MCVAYLYVGTHFLLIAQDSGERLIHERAGRGRGEEYPVSGGDICTSTVQPWSTNVRQLVPSLHALQPEALCRFQVFHHTRNTHATPQEVSARSEQTTRTLSPAQSRALPPLHPHTTNPYNLCRRAGGRDDTQHAVRRGRRHRKPERATTRPTLEDWRRAVSSRN